VVEGGICDHPASEVLIPPGKFSPIGRVGEQDREGQGAAHAPWKSPALPNSLLLASP